MSWVYSSPQKIYGLLKTIHPKFFCQFPPISIDSLSVTTRFETIIQKYCGSIVGPNKQIKQSVHHHPSKNNPAKNFVVPVPSKFNWNNPAENFVVPFPSKFKTVHPILGFLEKTMSSEIYELSLFLSTKNIWSPQNNPPKIFLPVPPNFNRQSVRHHPFRNNHPKILWFHSWSQQTNKTVCPSPPIEKQSCKKFCSASSLQI